MLLNRLSGRYRDYVELYTYSTETNDYGEPCQPVKAYSFRANVKSVSGEQLNDYSVPVTSSVITVRTRIDDRCRNSMLLKWKGVMYEVIHIRPDENNFEMIITCKGVHND